MFCKFPVICRKAESAIDDVVSPEGRGPPPEGVEQEGGPEVMRWMPYHNEGFRGKIRDSLIKHEIAEVSRIATESTSHFTTIAAWLTQLFTRLSATCKAPGTTACIGQKPNNSVLGRHHGSVLPFSNLVWDKITVCHRPIDTL